VDLDGAARDTDPPRNPTAATRAYLVCSTPRSGSGLLCRGLAATGVLATPLEYFNPARRQRLAERWGCGTPLAAYTRELLARRADGAGVFGSKLHWDQLVSLRAEALGIVDAEPEYEIDAGFLDRLFPGATYVRILRRDVNRQAISLWFALQTETWSVAAGDESGVAGRGAVAYSFEGIERCRRLIENAEVHWDRFFRFNRIEPVEVVYEALVDDYAGSVAALGRRIRGPDGFHARVPAEPDTRRLADDRSREFQERFARDREARGWQDPRG